MNKKILFALISFIYILFIFIYIIFFRKTSVSAYDEISSISKDNTVLDLSDKGFLNLRTNNPRNEEMLKMFIDSFNNNKYMRLRTYTKSKDKFNAVIYEVDTNKKQINLYIKNFDDGSINISTYNNLVEKNNSGKKTLCLVEKDNSNDSHENECFYEYKKEDTKKTSN